MRVIDTTNCSGGEQDNDELLDTGVDLYDQGRKSLYKAAKSLSLDEQMLEKQVKSIGEEHRYACQIL